MPAQGPDEPLVTAIVSTYAAEHFLRGCLEDLLAQTIADALEIVVFDACSPQDEAAIVREFQRSHGNIRYLRTAERVPTSVAFTAATAIARGRYLTIANTDDRHHPDFLALLTQVLEQHPQYGLVYADSLLATRAHETFAHNTATHRQAWPDFTLTAALSCCLFGAQPLWRRSAHELAGGWDHALRRADDQDMFLRIAWRCGAVHLRQTLGLFLSRPDSTSGRDHRQQTLAEVLTVMRRHRTGIPLEDLFPLLRECPDDAFARAAALFELGNLCALSPYTDAQLALDCYSRAAALPVPAAQRTLLRAAFASNSAALLACAGMDAEAARAFALCRDVPEAQRNQRLLAEARRRDAPPPPPVALSFIELAHPVVAHSRRGHALRRDGHGLLAVAEERRPWDVFEGPNGVPIEPAAGIHAARAERAEERGDERTIVLPQAAPAAARGRHVLLVQYGWTDSGGGTILPRHTALGLADHGCRVTVFCAAAQRDPTLPDYALRRHRDHGVEVVALYNRPALFMDLAAPDREIDDPRIRAIFAALLDELTPDVVHFFNLHNLGMSLPGVCKARGVPTVYSSNNYWPLCPRLYLASERIELCTGPGDDGSKCQRCLGQRDTAAGHARRCRAARSMLDQDVDVHLAVSQRVRDLYVQNGMDPARLRVVLQVPPQADSIWARTGATRRIVDELRRPLRAAFVGSCLPHKGVHVLAQALQLVPAGAVEAVALGDIPRDYRALLRQIDQRGALHCHGSYDQQLLPELLAKADVVVVPSIWDDCAPLVVAEALAARCPVIGSRIGGIPDFVRDGTNGLLFGAGDARDLASCLGSFTADRGRLGRLQRGITAPRGFAAWLDDLLAIYHELGAAQLAGTRTG